VKKSIAAIASRWLRRNASQRLAGSGSRGARRIQREMVRSETSKPSMRNSPWMRGAPHVGFSAIIRKINSRTSFGVCLRPTCVLTLEISLQYIRTSPVPPDQVSGVTMMRECFRADQTRRATTQKSLSKMPRLGRGCRRLSTTSCCRNARFSRRRLQKNLLCSRATLNSNRPPCSITCVVIRSSPSVDSESAMGSPLRILMFRFRSDGTVVCSLAVPTKNSILMTQLNLNGR